MPNHLSAGSTFAHLSSVVLDHESRIGGGCNAHVRDNAEDITFITSLLTVGVSTDQVAVKELGETVALFRKQNDSGGR